MSRQSMSLKSICSNVLELSRNRDEITSNEKWRQELDHLHDDCAMALSSPAYGVTLAKFVSTPLRRPRNRLAACVSWSVKRAFRASDDYLQGHTCPAAIWASVQRRQAAE